MDYNLEPLLKSFSYETGANAACTDLNGFYCTASDRFHLLQVWIPDRTGFVVCMTYVITKAGTYAADYAYS